MKPNRPSPPTDSTDPIVAILGAFGLAPPRAAAYDPEKDVHPRDNPAFVARLAQTAQIAADDLARATNCPCKRCRFQLPVFRASSFLLSELLRAVHTGDTANLERVAALCDELKAGAKAPVPTG